MKKALSFFGLLTLTGLALVTGCGQSCGFNEDDGSFVACADDLEAIDFENGGEGAVDSGSGSVYSDGQGFTGAIFNDGTGVTCGPDGGCIY